MRAGRVFISIQIPVVCRKVTVTSCYASKLVATDIEVSITGNQRSELSSIAQSRTLPGELRHYDAGGGSLLQHH
jgi:hypothetical protein